MQNKIDSRNLTKKVALLGVLTAMGVVLGRFIPILNVLTSKYDFSFAAVMLAAYFVGPLGGAVVGGLVDLIGALLFPTGAYFPGFTATAALTGLVFGLLLYKKCTFPRIVISVLSTQAVCSLLINTYFIATFFSPKGFTALLATRAIQAAVMSAFQIVFAEIFLRKFDIKKYLKI